MKKLILSSVIISSLLSCSDNQDIAREKIESHVFKNANDANSYEFIEMGKPDTVRQSNLIFNEMDLLNSSLKMEVEMLGYYKERVGWYSKQIKGSYGYIYLESYNSLKKDFDESSEKCKGFISSYKNKELLYNKLKNTDKDSIHKIIYTCHFRIGVPLGGLVKTYSTIGYYPNKEGKDKWSEVSLTEWDRHLKNSLRY